MTRLPARWVVPAFALAVSLALALALSWVGLGGRFNGDPAAVPAAPASAARGPAFSHGALAEPAPASDEHAARRPQPTSPPAMTVLHHWDRKRARAYAHGDAAALSALYVARCRAGTADVALLRDYLRRGLHVEGLRMQLLSVEVLERAPRRWRLRVTDRMDGGAAVGAGRRIRLPRDEASTRVVTLRKRGGAWKVAGVAASR